MALIPTALDRVVTGVQHLSRSFISPLDVMTRAARSGNPILFLQATQDSRYIAFCKEQDRRDLGQAQAALNEGGLVSLEQIKGEIGLEVIH